MIWSLWEELEREFGLRIKDTHVPHFSYHVARHYDLESLDGILRHRASESAPFYVTSKALGVFPAPSPIFFLPLVLTLGLAMFHRTLWQELSYIACGNELRYQPDDWIPGIALTPDIDKDVSAELVQFLLKRDLSWKIAVDNIAVIHDTGMKQELASRFDFAGVPRGRT